MNRPKFDAFISYRHTEIDKAIAEKLHKMLETYKLPGPVAKKCGKKKMGRVFKDREELPTSSNLAENIEQALENSEYLIVICSPRTPDSQWVCKEIETFAALKGYDRILALLIEGEPQESFPQPLRFSKKKVVQEDGQINEILVEVEPLAADIRAQNLGGMKKKLKTEILRLLAPILGCRFDDLKQRQRERLIRRVVTVSLSLSLFFLAFGSFSAYQNILIRQKSEEVARQSELIKQKSQEVERQSEQLKEQVDKTLEGQSLFLASISEELLDSGDRMLALMTAREALPQNLAQPDRPYVEEAEYALCEALYAYRPSEQGLVTDVVMNHKHPIEYMAISPDGKTFVTITSTYNLFVWNAENGQLMNQYRNLDKKVDLIKVFFIDEESIIISTQKEALCLDVHSLKERWSYAGMYQDFVLSEDKTKVVLINEAVHVLNAATGELLDKYSIEKTDMFHLFSTVALSPNGRYVCTSSNKDVYAFDLISKKMLGVYKSKYESTREIAVTDDGILGVSSYDDGAYALELIDLTSGKRLFSQEKTITVEQLRANPYDPDQFFYVTENTLHMASASKGEVTTSFIHGTWITDYTITPRFILTASYDGVLRYWDINWPQNTPYSMTFSDPLSRILWGNGNLAIAHTNKVYILRSVENEDMFCLEGHTQFVVQASYSSDGKRLISYSYTSGEMMLWDMENNKSLASVPITTSLELARFVENDQKVFTFTDDGTLSVYDATTLALLHQYALEASYPSITLSPDNSLCYINISWQEEKIFKTSDLSMVADVSGLNSLNTIFFQDNRRLVSADYSSLRIVDIETGAMIKEIPARLSEVKLSNNNQILACLYEDNSVGLLDAQTLDEIRNFGPMDISVQNIFFDSLDETLFIISQDYIIRRYNMESGELISEAQTKDMEPEEIVFSPDGKYYITIGTQKTLLWSNGTNKPLGRIESFLAVSSDFEKIMAQNGQKICIMPFYTPQKLMDKAENQLKGRTFTDQEKREFFIIE